MFFWPWMFLGLVNSSAQLWWAAGVSPVTMGWAGRQQLPELFASRCFTSPGPVFSLFWYFEVEVSNTTLAVKAQWCVCPVARSLICCSPRCHWRVDNSWSVAPHQTDASKLFFELFGASFVSQRDSWLEFWELCHLLALACRWLLPFVEGH